MDCNEFLFPILSVSLLRHGTDVVFNVPANAEGQDSVTLSETAATGYARLIRTDGAYGIHLIADGTSYSLNNQLTSKQGGQYQKVTLEYRNTSLTRDERTAFISQQSSLRQNFYSLLIEFFDGTYGLVRCFTHGDGYLFSSKEDDGEVTDTITITNLTGIQRCTIVQ